MQNVKKFPQGIPEHPLHQNGTDGQPDRQTDGEMDVQTYGWLDGQPESIMPLAMLSLAWRHKNSSYVTIYKMVTSRFVANVLYSVTQFISFLVEPLLWQRCCVLTQLSLAPSNLATFLFNLFV